MSNSFIAHWPNILFEEGSTLVSDDYGAGRARYGITELNNPDAWSDGDVTEEEAKQIYEARYWNPISGSRLPTEAIAGAVLDSAINIGPSRARKLAQRALGVTPDGIFGPITFGAFEKVNEKAFLNKFADLRIEDYKRIYEDNFPKFPQSVLAVWIARSNRYRNSKALGGALLPLVMIALVFFFG